MPDVIKLAVRGWDEASGVDSVEKVGAGAVLGWIEPENIGPDGESIPGTHALPWVEVNGCRLENVVTARYVAGDGHTWDHVDLRLTGRVEIVYVDHEGNPLPVTVPTD